MIALLFVITLSAPPVVDTSSNWTVFDWSPLKVATWTPTACPEFRP
jgi:hypothetical protein